MRSRWYPGEKPERIPVLTRQQRLALFVLACCIQLIYIPASNRVTGGIEPRLSIDVFPIWPVWVLPYVSCYALWFFAIARIVLKAPDREFRSFIAACLLTFSLAAVTFLLFPTYVSPALLPGNDLLTSILRVFHEQTGRYAALPSGHIYITTLLASFYSRCTPRTRPLWICILVIVSLSTLFTGQHYLLDLLAGYLVALAGYYFGLWWTGSHETQEQADRQPEKRVPSSSIN